MGKSAQFEFLFWATTDAAKAILNCEVSCLPVLIFEKLVGHALSLIAAYEIIRMHPADSASSSRGISLALGFHAFNFAEFMSPESSGR